MNNAAPEKPKKDKKGEDIRVEKGTMNLECRLSQDELKAAGKMLAEAIQRKETIERRLESFKTQAKAETAEADAIVSKQTQLVAAEKEFRLVPVEITLDFKAGTKTTVRLDTKEKVACVEISNEERQLQLA